MEEKKKGEIEDLEEAPIIKLDYSELWRILGEHDRNIAQSNNWNSLQAQQIEDLEKQVKELTERLNKLIIKLGNVGDFIE